MGIIKTDACCCERCQHIWLPAGWRGAVGRLPVRCAGCKSPYWNRSEARDAVYVMECEGYHKIGRGFNPGFRRDTMQIGLPFDITLVHSFEVDDASAVEGYLHGSLSAYRVRGEWFKLPPAVLSWLTSLSGNPENWPNMDVIPLIRPEKSTKTVSTNGEHEAIVKAMTDGAAAALGACPHPASKRVGRKCVACGVKL